MASQCMQNQMMLMYGYLKTLTMYLFSEILYIFKSLLVDLMEDLVEDIIKLERKPSQCEESDHHHQHLDHLQNHG